MLAVSTDRILAADTDVPQPAVRASLDLTENALRVLRARYLEKNEAGRCTETPDDLFDRVAATIAEIEMRYGGDEAGRSEWKGRFKRLMTSCRFMPNSPTLMNAGRSMGMLSACFVLPVPDSIDGIFDSIKHTALIQKAGGGTGFAFDELRPTGDYIKSSGGTTSGPISFWRAFSEATNAIQQGAFRRGANMGMMYIHHPDILKFLYAKQDLTQFTNYNISIKVTDAWMEAFGADPDGPHVTRNPRTGREYLLPRDLVIEEYNLKTLIPIEQHDEKTSVYSRRDIWDIIVNHAWQTGEPGVVFIDRINQANPTPHIGRMEATNPCGEQPLLPYEACNLGSINLGPFIKEACTPRAEVDWDALRRTVHESTRFLDNVIDANKYPLEQIDAICKANRKIGLGIMGFADALFKLGVPYNSEDGVAWGERFMKFVNDEAHNYSEKLAGERGCFPNWEGSTWDTEHHRPMRNSCATTVAPTGTISIIANCSGGVEPMFSLAFFRNVLKGQDEGNGPMIEMNETFAGLARERGFDSEGLMEQIATEGSLAPISGVPDDVKKVFVCAHDIEPRWHMLIQAAFQRHCDSSISKTINFPNDAKRGDVEEIYRMAYDLRCKGVTVYRDGCRENQPMALADANKKHKESVTMSKPETGPAEKSLETSAAVKQPGAASRKVTEETNMFGERITLVTPAADPLEPKELPDIMSGVRIRQPTPFGNMHVQITVDPRAGREVEVFAQLGKGGDLATSDLEAICRMISLWLRAGGRLNHVIKQLSGIGSSLQLPTKHGRIMSLGDGLARALKRYMRAKERHGLEPLLLGEVDPSAIDDPPGKTGGNGNGGKAGDITLEAANRQVEPPLSRAGMARAAYRLKCPECGGDLDNGEGCIKCHACGFAQC